MQPERTSLAWRRTVLTMVVVDLFIWRGWLASLEADGGAAGLSGRPLGLGLCAATAAATTAVLIICALLRLHELHGQAPGTHAAPADGVLRAAAGSVVALGAAAIVAIFLI
ncbi:DUF202 domain-containing protein [Paenarthrobacter sp. PH39-S1]|uniref:DUF202 domain-containing protein n=1 Tax=Paenarthrobacter sp. PH39-S1 TaxID=3046204 RepID=UPI0024BA644C|nr:DUF202 domain-containing protein [Paenarthrobacter sp. PH39-S1]MDJ0358332.1 DUF202 domain-containing protein [Paenarthrobacter sp. PH39-S1]